MNPLHYLRLFSASGADAGDFLHAQLSADITSLAKGDSTLAAWCSPRGQVIAPILVQRRESDWLLALESSLAADTILRLGRFVLRARVAFAALDHHGLAGLANTPSNGGHGGSIWLEPAKLGYVLAPSAPSHPSPDALLWKQRELRSGLSWLAPGTSDRFLPQMLGLDRLGAVSFSKGCYPGQEIVARARYLGRVKRRPLLLELDGRADLQAGEACTLSAPGMRVEGTILDSVCPDGEATTAIVVAAPVSEGMEAAGIRQGEHQPENADRFSAEQLDDGGRVWRVASTVYLTP